MMSDTPTESGFDGPDLQAMIDEVFEGHDSRHAIANSYQGVAGRLLRAAGEAFQKGDDTKAWRFRRAAKQVQRSAVRLFNEGIITADSIPADWSE
jgi:hypothetical protein